MSMLMLVRWGGAGMPCIAVPARVPGPTGPLPQSSPAVAHRSSVTPPPPLHSLAMNPPSPVFVTVSGPTRPA